MPKLVALRVCPLCKHTEYGFEQKTEKRTPSAAAIFKPWIVRRPDGGCQVLFPLDQLDGLIERVRLCYEEYR